jgi:hypothetical protein
VLRFFFQKHLDIEEHGSVYTIHGSAVTVTRILFSVRRIRVTFLISERPRYLGVTIRVLDRDILS